MNAKKRLNAVMRKRVAFQKQILKENPQLNPNRKAVLNAISAVAFRTIKS
jgi:hypothetical protein